MRKSIERGLRHPGTAPRTLTSFSTLTHAVNWLFDTLSRAMDSPILFSVTHAGRTVDLSLSPSSSLASLADTLSNEFDLSPSSLKLLFKGKKLAIDGGEADSLQEVLERTFGPTLVAESRTKPIKALLVGTKRSEIEAMEAQDALRRKKHDAFLFHQQHQARPSSRSGVHSLSDSSSDPAHFRFHHLEPFPKSVPFFDRRKAMLERLAEDPAVKDVMRRHKFAVGVLCVSFVSTSY